MPDPNSGVFTIPRHYVKNRDVQFVVLNSIAHEIVKKQHGKTTEHVFTYKDEPITSQVLHD